MQVSPSVPDNPPFSPIHDQPSASPAEDSSSRNNGVDVPHETANSPPLPEWVRSLRAHFPERYARIGLTISFFSILFAIAFHSISLAVYGIGTFIGTCFATVFGAALDRERLQDAMSHRSSPGHFSTLQMFSGVNPTHLRLTMMDRDFTPNDYETLLYLDEEARAGQVTGIPQSQIDRLPVHTVSASDVVANKVSICSVCLEMPKAGDTLRTVPCLHKFHSACIDKWLRTKPSCPVCNFPVGLC